VNALVLASEQAEKKVSYAGTKVLRFYRPEGGGLATERVVKVWHRSPEQTRVEMVTPADILGMVVLESPEGIWIFHPRRQSWRQMKWRAPEARPQLLLRNYDVSLLRREKVAGRPAYVLRLASRHPGNPSKTVWIDAETKLALRQDLFDPDGRLLSASQFREISFSPSLPGNLFTVPVEARVDKRREADGPLAGAQQPPWATAQKAGQALPCEQPRYVPAGYELVHRFCLKRPEREFAHLRYTDGLNTISLFIERSSAGAATVSQDGRRGRRRHGGPGSDPQRGEHGRRFSLQRGDTRYTLVGNINASELRRMAESIPTPGKWPDRSKSESVSDNPRWKQ
jgi:negative regulator of sigma E activity